MNIKDFKSEVKCKYHVARIRLQNDANKVANWCGEHPEAALAIGGAAYGAVKYFGKNGIKYINLQKAQNVKELFVYDPSLGHYWELSRKLTNAEWLHVDQARSNGERMANILSDMGVLKGKRFGL